MEIKYEKKREPAVRYDSLEDKECFFSGGVLYMKIFEQDLKEYGITCVNAVSIINAGLTKFDPDEEVYRAYRTVKK